MQTPTIPIRSAATGADVTALQARDVAFWLSEAALESPLEPLRALGAGDSSSLLVLGREPRTARQQAASFTSLPHEPGLSEAEHCARHARATVGRRSGHCVAGIPRWRAAPARPLADLQLRASTLLVRTRRSSRPQCRRPAGPRCASERRQLGQLRQLGHLRRLGQLRQLRRLPNDRDLVRGVRTRQDRPRRRLLRPGRRLISRGRVAPHDIQDIRDRTARQSAQRGPDRPRPRRTDRPRARGRSPSCSRGIDWHDDARLDEAIVPARESVDSGASGIFLTGATGYLGAYLLAKLLERGHGPVHCLVRAASPDAALRRIRETFGTYRIWRDEYASRIVPVIGDLEQPRLGLSEREFGALAAQVGRIYHAGARVHFTLPYASLRKSNVHGTHEIIRLAAEGTRKSLHHISTTAVFPDIAYPNGIIREDLEPTQVEALSTGYAETKWVAERLVVAARARGIPVTIHRVGSVTGDARTGICRTDDAIWRIVKGCVQLGMAPDLAGELSSAAINHVTAAIVHLTDSTSPLGTNYHLTCPRATSWRTIFDTLRDDGHSLARGDIALFRAALDAIGPDNHLYPIAHLLRAMREEPSARFDCRNTNAALTGSGIALAPLDRNLLGIYFRELIRSGFLPHPALSFRTEERACVPG